MRAPAPYTISMVSGKGGSGKTSVSLSLAAVLARLRVRTIVVDLDFSTHGASYFFEPSSPGIADLPDHSEDHLKSAISEAGGWGFDLMPSRTRFGRSSPDRHFDPKQLTQSIRSVSEQAGYECIIFDCQAGVSSLARAALAVTDVAVIVTEADTISTKALRNLQVQLHESLPRTKVLINKLFLREQTTYEQLTAVLSGLEFLPPVPFDMDVRAAFAKGEIPIGRTDESAFGEAMLRIVREIHPKLSERVSAALQHRQDKDRKDVQSRLRELQARKTELEYQISRSERLAAEARAVRERRVRLIPPLVMGGLSGLYLAFDFWLDQLSSSVLLAVSVGVAAYVWVTIETVRSRTERQERDFFLRREVAEKEISTLSEEIQKYEVLRLNSPMRKLTHQHDLGLP